MEQAAKQRIIWIDVYKAICIILVVVGHATGLFNHYIYQFHMAAFFFISGYTSKIWKKDLESVVIDKARTLLLPLLSMVVGIGCVRAIIAIFSPDITFKDGAVSILTCIKNFLIHGITDPMLGAAWFLIALFFVFIIQRLIWKATEKAHIAVYAVATVVVYLIGYYLQKNGYRQTFCFDMALIGQVFFGMGVFLSKCNALEWLRKQKWCYAIYAVAGLWMFVAKWLGGKVAGGATVDYPSRVYPNVWMTFFVPIGGILFVFGISELIGRLGPKITKPFCVVGSSTLGVLFFHFIGFKIATLLLCLFKITTLQDTQAFLLPASAQAHGWCWFFYSVVSLLFCIGVWKVLMMIPYVNILLGKKWALKGRDPKAKEH
ncbi:MAG: hypothetical protein E7590_02665 [Ruminococcaceae bacterium]|nr:hypothetical protein [Oscillospiraceae bacterium]